MQVDFGHGRQRCIQVGSRPLRSRAHRGVQHLRVQVESDFLQVPGLRLAQNLAGSADLQVVHGQGKAASELLQILDRLPDASPRCGSGHPGPNHQVGVA